MTTDMVRRVEGAMAGRWTREDFRIGLGLLAWFGWVNGNVHGISIPFPHCAAVVTELSRYTLNSWYLLEERFYGVDSGERHDG